MRHHIWIVLLVLILSGVSSVYADAVVGTGTRLDCKESTLRAALDVGGLITFNCGSDPHTIRVTGTLTVRTDTVIDGGGLITLDGLGTTQILNNNGHQLEIRNLSIRNASGRRGGAIHNVNGSLNINNVNFNVNRAVAESEGSPTDGLGGAIYSTDSILGITNSHFIGNRAENWGGAVYVSGGFFSMEHNQFILNVARRGGGAISNSDSNTGQPPADGSIRNNNVFSLNMAGTGPLGEGVGGAIYTIGGYIVTQGNFFGVNIANRGGAIYTYQLPSDGAGMIVEFSEFNANLGGAIVSFHPITVEGSEFINNRSLFNNGGAIFLAGDTEAEIFDSTFTGNRAVNGGAIAVSGDIDVEIFDNTFTGNHASNGGAIYNNARNFILRNSTFLSNTARDGGALYNSNELGSNTHRLVQNSTFSANSAGQGGAIFDQPLAGFRAAHGFTYATQVEYSTFAYNSATLEGGGAVIYAVNGSITLKANIFAYSVGNNCNTNLAPVYTLLEYPDNSCGGGTWTDPLLESLADNGGSTMTHALSEGSPAIDAIRNNPLTTGTGTDDDPILCAVNVDQRYFARPANATGLRFAFCDIGAYEYLAVETTTVRLLFAESTAEPTLPPVPTSIPILVNCTPFRITSPLDGFPDGVATFYWDAAPGATSYLLNIINEVGQEVASFSVNAPTTTLTGDVSHNAIGGGTNFTWIARALYNGQVYCTSQTTIPRESPNNPPPPQNTPVPRCGNGIREAGENPNNCPNGY